MDAEYSVKGGSIQTPLRVVKSDLSCVLLVSLLKWLRKDYLNNYEEEIEINHEFNRFAANVQRIFGGENTVEAQTGYPSNRREYNHSCHHCVCSTLFSTAYTSIDSDEQLPLSPEFQTLIRCFVDPRDNLTVRQKYAQALRLVNYMRVVVVSCDLSA